MAAIERMRERAALLKAARDQIQDIRSGLGGAAPKTIPHSFGFRPGIDPDKLNQLADEPESEAFVASPRKPRDPARRQRTRTRP